MWCYRCKSNINVWLFQSIGRWHFKTPLSPKSFFFFFFFFNIFHKVCFNPVTNGSCSVNIVWSLFGIRAKIAAFQITQVISMRVLERGLLTLDQLYYHFFYSICKVQWNKEKLQTVHYNIRALPKIKTSYQSWRNLTIRSCFWSSIP